jgi:lactate dehydrogenase-like 2-hydroxyacid dehydrogenase
MSERSDKVRLALLCPLAADLHAALAERFELIEPGALAQMPATERQCLTRAVTMAMRGAPTELLDLLPALDTLVSCGAGLETYDPAALAARGIALHPTPDVMAEDTADMAVALVYAVARNIVQGDHYVRNGRWAQRRSDRSVRVVGKRAGIVGLGRIGTRVAQRLAGIGLQVSYFGPREKPGVTYPYVGEIKRLASEVDFLVLTCSGGSATHHLVDRSVLEKLGPDGFLINVSRGSVVDEEALLDALEAGAIAGAGLDVFAQEPTPNPRFLALGNVVVQPHASVLTHENLRDLVAKICRILA